MSVITISQQGHLATITLNRPEKHNAFDETMIERLISAFRNFEDDPEIFIIHLKGAGRSFCAGADLEWMQRTSQYSYDRNFADAQRLALLMCVIDNSPKFVMTTVHGSVFGGAVGLAAVSDLVFAEPETIFSLSEVKLGLLPAVISPFVANAIGGRMARRYLLTGERFNAETACHIGLVHDVCDAEALQKKRDKVIDEMRWGAPSARAETKALLKEVLYHPYSTEISDKTAHAIAKARSSKVGQHGIQAFLDKEKIDWTTVLKGGEEQ